MMSHYKKRTAPYGFPFLDAQSTKLLQERIDTAFHLLQKEGYEPVTPASLDYPETFLQRSQGDTFYVRDRLGEELALRSDATVQLIKGFANFLESSDKKEENKFCYSVKVFKDKKKSYPALREVFQVGAEEIGIEEKKAIPNLLKLSYKIFSEAFDKKITLVVGDVRIFHFFADYLNEIISSNDLRDLLVEKNIPSFKEILQKKIPAGLAKDLARELLFSLPQTNWQQKISAWQKDYQAQENFFEKLSLMLRPLQELNQNLKEENFDLHIEPLLLRKTTYYSGIVFEGYCENLSHPPLKGGSYDNLVEKYSNIHLPASGFAIDVSPLAI